jgi:hypothetical protein
MERSGRPKAADGLEALLNPKPAATGPRKLGDWIESFEEYSKGLSSPALFKRWGAIVCLAMAMERKVFLRTNLGALYPNLYVMAIAPPGVGKTLITSKVGDLIRSLPEHHVAPSSVTRASLIDALVASERRVVIPQGTPPVLSFNALAVVQNEMGVFLPAYDTEFMATLTDLYDGKKYSEKKRSKDINNSLDHPCLSLFGATTVAYLYDTMPEQAWDHGFLSRTILIHSGEMIIRSLFDFVEMPEQVEKDLIHDLKIIGNLTGRFKFTQDAATAIDRWHQSGGTPKPDHPKLTNYNSRRTTHILKLCMVAAVSEGNELIITLEHFHRALEWLLEAESFMPDIFKSMSVGGDAKAIEDTYYWAYKIYMKEGKNISEDRIVEYLANKVPAHSVERIMQLMVKARLFEKVLNEYRPRAKKDN